MRYCDTLTVCVAAATVSGCGGSQPPIGAQGAVPQIRTITPVPQSAQHLRTPALSDQTLFSFSGGSGKNPSAGLIDVSGTLYGTTSYGGAYGEGTVFSITTDGTECVLHSFGSGSDGRCPEAALTT